MKPPDENDRLRAGELPVDPTNGTVSIRKPSQVDDPSVPRFRWRSMADLVAQPDEPVAWLWPGVIALGAVTLVWAPAKVGKTWVLFAWIARRLCGAGWLDHPPLARRIRVLLVSEEPEWLLKFHAKRFGIAEGLDYLTLDALPPDASWKEILEEVVAKAKAVGAELVVLDTISTLAGIEDENSARDVNAALVPVSRAARVSNLAFVPIHHASAAGRTRGSTVWRAVPDALVEVERVGDKGSRKRSLSVEGRLPEAPEAPIVVEYVPPAAEVPATFRAIQTSAPRDDQAERHFQNLRRVEALILDLLRREPWLTRKEVIERLGEKKFVEEALPTLEPQGKAIVNRVGRYGVFRYALPETPPPSSNLPPKRSGEASPSRGKIRRAKAKRRRTETGEA